MRPCWFLAPEMLENRQCREVVQPLSLSLPDSVLQSPGHLPSLPNHSHSTQSLAFVSRSALPALPCLSIYLSMHEHTVWSLPPSGQAPLSIENRQTLPCQPVSQLIVAYQKLSASVCHSLNSWNGRMWPSLLSVKSSPLIQYLTPHTLGIPWDEGVEEAQFRTMCTCIPAHLFRTDSWSMHEF